MGLSCSCDYDLEPGMVGYEPYEDYTTLIGKRRTRCCSCKDLINLGAVVFGFYRFKVANYKIEEAIYGEGGEVPRAHHFMCETCGDIYNSLDELGFCLDIDNNMNTLLKEYVHDYGVIVNERDS